MQISATLTCIRGYVLYKALAYFLFSFFYCTVNDSRSGGQIPRNFLPFGPDRGDSIVPTRDDGATDEIILGTNVIIFGSSHNRLYVSQHDAMGMM